MLAIVVYLLGVHIGVQGAAALLNLIDVWTSERVYLRAVVWRSVFWWGGAGGVALLLDTERVLVFSCGLISPVLAYPVSYFFLRYAAPRVWHRRNVR